MYITEIQEMEDSGKVGVPPVARWDFWWVFIVLPFGHDIDFRCENISHFFVLLGKTNKVGHLFPGGFFIKLLSRKLGDDVSIGKKMITYLMILFKVGHLLFF